MIALKPDMRNSAVLVDIVEAAPFNNPHNKHYVGKEYSGIGGRLFAEAVRESFIQSFGGYVYFVAKYDLIEHYQKELGAVLLNPKCRILAIEEGSAKNCMSNTIKRNYELDNYGALTEHTPDDAPRYDFAKIRDCCRKNNKTLADMNEKEIEQFKST